ncbi:unnamed protein product [Lymnaea stagnalis]|uniref:Uncharacterized protein n=1 Tax=Lymnaea stagnalis TaxID=6523 RepID=A0AAV2GY58_LYMST
MKMENFKRNNDPWLPLDEDLTTLQNLAINPIPANPLHQMIDSEKYIQSLEQKLKKISKARQGEPTSHEIISSLALFHDDQMRRYIDDTNINSFTSTGTSANDEPTTPLAFMQRKLHPEKQPLNAEEILELVKEDILDKTFEEILEKKNGDSSRMASSGSTLQLTEVTQADAKSSRDTRVPLRDGTQFYSGTSRNPSNSECSSQEEKIITINDSLSAVILNSATTTATTATATTATATTATTTATTIDENWASFEDMNSQITTDSADIS